MNKNKKVNDHRSKTWPLFLYFFRNTTSCFACYTHIQMFFFLKFYFLLKVRSRLKIRQVSHAAERSAREKKKGKRRRKTCVKDWEMTTESQVGRVITVADRPSLAGPSTTAAACQVETTAGRPQVFLLLFFFLFLPETTRPCFSPVWSSSMFYSTMIHIIMWSSR